MCTQYEIRYEIIVESRTISTSDFNKIFPVTNSKSEKKKYVEEISNICKKIFQTIEKNIYYVSEQDQDRIVTKLPSLL